MGNIFFLMGKSSTGKDSIFNRLLDNRELGLKRIVPYTTRPIRAGEVDGVDYNFCDKKQMEELKSAGKIIEIRSYPTIHGLWDYFTVDDGRIEEAGNFATIGTLESYIAIRDYYKNCRIVPIYIEVEDGVRLRRALEREDAQDIPRYEELCRRFLADSEDFSEEKLKDAGINMRFYNDDVDKTVAKIAKYIKETE